MIKQVTSVMCIVAVLIAFCACGSDSAETGNTQTIKGSEPDLAYKVSDKPLTLNFFYAGLMGSLPFQDTYPVFQEAKRLTNVELKGTVPQSNSDPAQAFVTMMASGKLDDIVTANKTDFDKYADSGAFVPLDPLIEQYAPNIKKFLEEHPDLKKCLTQSDGHIYCLPKLEQGDTAKGWYIRQDWLDALQLPQPTTVDEYYRVLKAFKEQDPNGNGIADEIPYFDRQANLDAIFNLFGVPSSFYYDEEAGEVKHGAYIPEYKDAVKNAAQWYAEGLIDRELYTRGGNAREQLLGNNTGGSTHDWFTSTANYNQTMQESVPGINFTAIAPPADINGIQWEETSRGQSTLVGWGIAASNQHQEETIKYFDFWYTEAGNRLINYGVEGQHYTMVDGSPKFTDDFLSSTKAMTATWWGEGMALYIGSVQDFDAERQWMSEEALQAVDLYIQGGYIRSAFPQISFNAEEQKVISEKWTAIQSYMQEQEQNWIFGTQNVDETFDAYMQRCAQLGMDEILDIYNTAYQRYLSN